MDRATGEGRVSQMSDNLRDRIKEEVLDGILSMFSEDDSVEMAAGYITDAVISELGLQTRLAKRIINGKPDKWVRRYATDWEIVD